MAERTSSLSSAWTNSSALNAVASTVLGTVHLPVRLPSKSIRSKTRAVSATKRMRRGARQTGPIQSNGYGEWERQVGSA